VAGVKPSSVGSAAAPALAVAAGLSVLSCSSCAREDAAREVTLRPPAGPLLDGDRSAVERPTPRTAPLALITVPAGHVAFGGKPRAVAAFSMDRTEVTVQAYLACEKSGAWSPAARAPGCNAASPEAKAEHPIDWVTRDQAERFCAAASARLPTVEEWGLAAGGSEGRTYPWGEVPPSNLWLSAPPSGEYEPAPARHHLCWRGDGTAESERYPEATCPVGSYAAGETPLGLADMAGNVWEWTKSTLKLPGGQLEFIIKGGGYALDSLGPPPCA